MSNMLLPATCVLTLLIGPAAAKPPQEAYRLPPAEIIALVDAPLSPAWRVSPDGKSILVIESAALPTIEDVSRRMLRLAGTRVDPVANAPHRTTFDRGLVLRSLSGDMARRVPLPEGMRLAWTSWSQTSNLFAFVLVGSDGSELWTASVEDPGHPVRRSTRLNTLLGSPTWMPDGHTLLFREVPAGRAQEPAAPRAPRGPNVQTTTGESSPLRTYQDLLANPHDEALFVHYAETQLVLVSAADGKRRELGAPAIFRGVSPAPDGEHFLVERIRRPFSYLMPYWLFPHSIEVWDGKGERSATVAEVPLGENIPIGGVRTGPRDVEWRTGVPAELVWTEALDGGDPDREVEHRDRFMVLTAPYAGEPRELCRIAERSQGLRFLADPGLAIATEYDRDRRWLRALLFDVSGEEGVLPGAPRVLEDRSLRDRYGDPGSIVLAENERGFAVPVQRGPWIYRSGAGASPEGLLPFLDRQNMETLATERLWRCETGAYESVVELIFAPESADDDLAFVTRRETPEQPPNYVLRDLGGEAIALTEFPDPTPEIRGITKSLVTYERSDGVPLSATLYLPAGYEAGTRLPLVVWAYPLEFNDPGTAGQVTSSPWRFTQIRGISHLALLTQGYCVLDGATMPVIGDPETMNDTFIEQIVDAAQAAIDKAVELGVADRERVAVGGHSYGAFMTANLLAHSNLFRAGIARSGAYNRSLTPFGFQSERRTFWEAPEAYFRVSPFMHADTIEEPLLLVHGEIDNNSGTYPLQSQRMFQAIKGLGGTARLVMLPAESHGYRARESVLHVLAEMVEWLDLHVKRAGIAEASSPR